MRVKGGPEDHGSFCGGDRDPTNDDGRNIMMFMSVRCEERNR